MNADLKDTRDIVNRQLQKEGKNTFKKIKIVEEEDEEDVRNEEQREIKRQKNEQ